MMPDDKRRHDFTNHLGIILGFAEVLLTNMSPDDARRSDVEEIRKAATAALALLAGMFPDPITNDTQRDSRQNP